MAQRRLRSRGQLRSAHRRDDVPGQHRRQRCDVSGAALRHRQQLPRHRLPERHPARRQRRQSARHEGSGLDPSPKWAGGKTRIYYIADYYDGFNQVVEFAEKTFGWKQVPDGSHDDVLITAIIMTVSPDHVRMKQRTAKGLTKTNSIELAPVAKASRSRQGDRESVARRSRSRRSRRRSAVAPAASRSSASTAHARAMRGGAPCSRRVQSLLGDRAFGPCSG